MIRKNVMYVVGLHDIELDNFVFDFEWTTE